ncbi:MAG: MFS transporter [Ignavibacteriales bacterium]|nr:MFS transporter [Ignavibacteriales bacterium]
MNSLENRDDFEKSTYSKVTRRLIPFLFLCYILAYVDRVNVSFARLQMQQDLGMSDTVFGAGMGLFFIGYFFFEVPSNIMLKKIGARFWIGPIMIIWGIVSSSMMLVKSPFGFYLLRFLLGIVESGFFPGVVLYLTFWYTDKYRAKMVAAFMSAIALSGAFGSPMSGWIMSKFSTLYGLTNWQWLFLIEGIPSVIVGIVALYFLDDGPQSAKWLKDDERNLLLNNLDKDEKNKSKAEKDRHRLIDIFKSSKVWLLCFVYFGFMMSNYYIGFWMPQLIKDNITTDPWQIGLISIIPWGFGAVAMVVWAHHSDKTGERRWHVAIASIIAAIFLIISGIQNLPVIVSVAVLALATAGILSGLSTFWALPTSLLSGTAAAAGIAWINSVGNLGGFVSPYVVGWIRDNFHNQMYVGLVIATASTISAGLVLLVARKNKAIFKTSFRQND